MDGFRYDTFEDHAQITQWLEKNHKRSVDYMTMPDQWDLIPEKDDKNERIKL